MQGVPKRARVISEAERAMMLALLGAREDIHLSEIARACGLRPTTVWAIAGRLQDDGLLETARPGGRSAGRYCSLTTDGTDLAKLVSVLRAANAPGAAGGGPSPFTWGETKALSELRKMAGQSVAQVAAGLETTADVVVRIETDISPMLSDVGSFLGALGGDLLPLACVGPALVPLALTGAVLDESALLTCLASLGNRLAPRGARGLSPFVVRRTARLEDLRALARISKSELKDRRRAILRPTDRLDRMPQRREPLVGRARSVSARGAERDFGAIPAELVLLAVVAGRSARVAFPGETSAANVTS